MPCQYDGGYSYQPGSKNASKRVLRQWPPRRLRSQILNKLLGALWLASLLWKQMQLLAPAALTRQDLGIYSDIVMAPQPLSHGTRSSDDSRNTRRRLETFSSPEDEQARSAVFLRFPCKQYHTGITKWINKLCEEFNMPAFNKLVRNHCKAGSVSLRRVSGTRGKCQDFVARYKGGGIPNGVNSPFCYTNTNNIVRQSK